MQMFVTGLKKTYFYIWTERDTSSIEEIEYDSEFFLPYVQKAEENYYSLIGPEYFEQRKPRRLDPLEL